MTIGNLINQLCLNNTTVNSSNSKTAATSVAKNQTPNHKTDAVTAAKNVAFLKNVMKINTDSQSQAFLSDLIEHFSSMQDTYTPSASRPQGFSTYSPYYVGPQEEPIILDVSDDKRLARVYSMPSWVDLEGAYDKIKPAKEGPGYDVGDYFSSGAAERVGKSQKAYEAALRDFGLIDSNPNAFIPLDQLKSLSVQVENNEEVTQRYFEYLNQM